MPASLYFDSFVPFVRQQCGPLYHQHMPGSTPRSTYYGFGINLMESIITGFSHDIPVSTGGGHDVHEFDKFFPAIPTENYEGDFGRLLEGGNFTLSEPVLPITTINPSTLSESKVGLTSTYQERQPIFTFTGQDSVPRTTDSTSGTSHSPISQHPGPSKVEAHDCCDICGYRPKGDPQWFKGSMAKHKKLQHANAPPKIYKCPFPGCTSQYKNRPDNLRQHQLDKNHFVDEEGGRKPAKRKKTET